MNTLIITIYIILIYNINITIAPDPSGQPSSSPSSQPSSLPTNPTGTIYSYLLLSHLLLQLN